MTAPSLLRLLFCVSCALGGCGYLTAAFDYSEEEVERFFDDWAKRTMTARRIPGVVVVMCRGRGVSCSRGYGVADLSSGREMDPETTILRVGSISKLVAATAVLQLAERGKLDLSADVRQYLGEDVLVGHPLGITLQRLLTHTAGVGDKFVGQTVADPAELLNLRRYLIEETPPPLSPPGFFVNYSSVGISLAALVVESISGMPFAEYVETEIFRPLEMMNSNYVPDPGMIARAASGYSRLFGRFRLIELRHWRTYPASSLVSTGHDMARFMNAHLGGGDVPSDSSPGRNIFSAQTHTDFHRRQFTMHPRVPGLTYTFWERVENGVRLLWHSGHMPGHRTGFFLIPRDGIGLFINGNSEFSLEEPFITEFLDRFYPSVVSPPEETVGRSGFHDSGDEVLGPLPGALSQYTGRFRHSWYPRTSMGKAVALTGIQGVERVVRLPGGDGRGILIDGNVYLPRAPDFFAEVSGDGIAGFWRSLKGEVVFLYEGGMNGYHRIRWYESVNLHRVAISLLAVIFGASLFAGVRSWVRGGQTRKDETVRPGLPARLTRCSAVMMSGLLTLFILGMALMAVTGVYRITQEVRWPLLGLLALPMLAGVALLGLLGGLAASWRDPALQSRERVSYVGLILCASLTFALMNYWMMLGYRF